ncbi:sensor histidine kinase [Aquabacterium parvum]|uniref:sensor histidine kinase n=1 Tax=Aquabacterium parvum TaxID=70584 RepID=UPI000718FFEA|nr:DUF4118 domain-containing protein [Aquabacterium parvum]MBU0918036.1 PAS domain-containing sensor histidine kinase [Gammaproteobacteria bacterium]
MPSPLRARPTHCLTGGAGWLLGWLAACALDGIADLGNQALPLVLAAAFASLWWPAWLATLACVVSVLAFNWLFVLPLGSFHVSLERDWESLEEIVGAVLRRVRARDPGRRVQARIAPGLPLLHCDAVLMVQLLENLIDNALKYAPTEQAIEVKGRLHDQRVCLAVRDHGPGIPVQERHRLSQAFERGDAGRRSGSRGAGLGLALCQAIARAHGATFILRERDQGGCHAEVCFPLTTAPRIDDEEATA